MRSPTLRTVQAFSTAILVSVTLQLGVGGTHPAFAQQQPMAIVAVASIDRLLEDVDELFAAGEAPQHAQMIRGVIANFNDLRGLDRQRPVGLYLFFPAGGQKDPQPLLFFPVTDVDELLTSIRIGNALRLKRGDADDRLTLHTEDGELPVRLQHGYAFVDPTKTGTILNQSLLNPADLLGEALADDDAVLIVRREGIPPFLFEVAVGQLRTEALKQQPQNDGESDAEYTIRRGLQEPLFSLMESAVKDWREATVGLRLSADDRETQMDASIALDAGGRTLSFLKSIQTGGRRFAAQLAEPSAFSLSVNWQPTQTGRDLLSTIVETFREQVDAETADADAESREAVTGVIDALEAAAAEGAFDSYVQLLGAPPNSFVLMGAARVDQADKVAAGIERLLPFAVESKDIREIEMNVARAGDVAVHRLWPNSLRKQDRRLYGKDAAIYLAAGREAVWMALGGEGTADLLAESIQGQAPGRPQASTDSGSLTESHDLASHNSSTVSAYLDLTVHASDWIGFARTDGGGRNARFARLARQAFDNPEEDGLRLRLFPTDEGLQATLRLDYGYIRLIGLALAERLSQQP